MSPKSLIIVESPTKSKTLNKFLSGEYLIEASMGHIRDLPQKKLGYKIIGDRFEPEYEIISRAKKNIETIKKYADRADKIFLATDPDREGEAIAWHLFEILKKNNTNIQRIEFHEITKKAILSAIENATQINMSRVDAQQARRLLDRIVGYNLSPMLWKYIAKNLSAGRVQSVAVRIICEREEEIQNFKPEEYWKIKVWLLTETKDSIEFELLKINGKKANLPNNEKSNEIVNILKTAKYEIDKIIRRSQFRQPPAPLITSKLQQLASSKFNYSPDRTMRIAQQLYEGITLANNETVGLITYMRTDSIRISDEAKSMAADYIKKTFGAKYSPQTETKHKQKNTNIQDAHEAIRPTDISRTPEILANSLTKEQYRIYKLIWDIFTASQMSAAEFDTTTITVLADKKFLFAAKGSILKFDGFLKVYQPETQKDVTLPNIKETENLTFEKIEATQHFTKPPARFTEATLVKELEDKGIGRPSTYATIVSTIINRNYVKKENKTLIPTELGKRVNQFLVKYFHYVIQVGFTAELETKLDKVENENYDWQKLLKEFYITFENDLKNAEILLRKTNDAQKTDFKCEKCGAEMLLKRNVNGEFIACSKYPQCKNTKSVIIEKDGSIKIKNDKLDETCPVCGKPLRLRRGSFGEFIACSGYPNCRYSRSAAVATDSGIICPLPNCGGQLIKRQIKTGKNKGKFFFGCSNFTKGCKFVEWNEIVNKECPDCENKYLIITKKNKESQTLECPKKECGYKEVIDLSEIE